MGLQVWLPLNGNLNNQGLMDVTATNNGATIDNNGKIGKCYSFDGSDDFINLGSIGLFFDGSAFSICFWIYSLENTTRAAVFSSYGLSSTSNFFGLELNSSNGSYCNNNLRFDWLGSDTYSPADFITYNAWTHVCVTYDGINKINMYKNGELIQTSTRVLNPITVGNNYYLGRDSRTGTTAFSGKLNDFRIYDHCLSPREIKEISKGLVLHYPLAMPGQVNLLAVQISNNYWTNWRANATWDTNNTREKILGEDGRTWAHIIQNTSDGYGGYACDPAYNQIVIDSSKKYTWSCIAKAGAKENAEIILWCHWRSTEGGNNLSQNSKKFQLTSNPQRISWTLPQYTNATYTVNRINLMMGTQGTGNNEIYFTDVKFEEGEIATPWIPKIIGQDNLFDFEPVASKWTAESCTVADYFDNKWGNALQITTTQVNQRIYRYVTNVWEANQKYTVSFIAKATTPIQCDMSRSIADFSPTFNLNTEWRRYTGIINCTQTNSGGTLSFRLLTAGTVYITNITLEKGDTTSAYDGFDNTEYDVSGYGNNGTKVGTITYDSDTPRYNTSTILDGTYISLASLTSSTIPQFSICGWVNLLTGYTANYGCHLINFNKTYCRICVSKDGAALKILLTDGTTNYTLASVMTASSLSANVWNHYAVTFDNGSIKIYINGQLDRSAQAAITAISPSTSSWTIGNHGTTEFPKAKVSDIRFYSTALSADDILELYHTPISLSNNGTLLTQGEYVES